jgi:hypothetical protein
VTVTTRVPAVIDYLVTTFQAASTLGQATPPVAVFDGPAVTSDPAPLQLWVGVYDPDSEDAQIAANTEQSWAGLGHMAKNEQLSVRCTAVAWSGTDDVRTVRLSCAAIVAAVETLVLADATLGGTVTVPGNANVTGGEWWQNTTTRGAIVQLRFEITAQARIGN